LERQGKRVQAVVHHGNVQDSRLFSEEVIVTTYDQIVCAVPGVPLSLPLSAGHAVAGALLMSRLVLDEVHLAWSISPEALTILFGILEFRQRLGCRLS
jgi:CRISPR/Cas system-associated endonuclease/helicase Cas3